MFPEPTDTFGVLNHMFHTCPLDKNTQNIIFERKPKLYSFTRNKINIHGKNEKNKNNVLNHFKFTDKILDIHHVIYPKMNIILYKNNELENMSIHFTKKKLPFNCYLLGKHRWSNNYYHFITEALPSIIFMNKYLFHYPVIVDSSKFIEPLLQFFNVDNQLVTHNNNNINNYQVLFQQEYIECGNPSPEKIGILREYIESHVEFQPSIGVLIYRKESTRSIVNHDELLECLRNLTPNMEWNVFNEATIADTVDLFSRAKVIVAPHGAGLTNMIFSKKGIKIIEFMPIENPNICYWHLSEVVGHRYNMIPVNEVDGGKLLVDMGEVQPILAELLADAQ